MNTYTTKDQTTIDLLFSNHPHQTVSSIYCYWYDHNIIYTVINDQKMCIYMQYTMKYDSIVLYNISNNEFSFVSS